MNFNVLNVKDEEKIFEMSNPVDQLIGYNFKLQQKKIE